MPSRDFVAAVLVGPPCSGKGHVARTLSKALDLRPISPGELYRKEMEDETELGLLVKEILKDGSICPDAMTNDLIDRELARECQSGNGRILLDGYPRTLVQLDHLLERCEVGCFVLMEASVEVRRRASVSRGRWDDGEIFDLRDATYLRETAPMEALIRDLPNTLSFNTLEDLHRHDAIAVQVREMLERKRST